jgi:DNA-binding HxlR family transcriptional regulator
LEKPTRLQYVTRSYGDRCGIARALDVVGERWALLVVRELLLGPKRFTDLRTGLPNVGPDVLSQRLRDLEQAGIVRRGKLPPPAASHIYELTEWGQDLEPVVLGLGRWGSRAPGPPDAELGPDSAVLALKTMFDPGKAGKLEATYELRFGENAYRLRVAGGTLHAARRSADRPDAVIDTDPGTLASVLWHGQPLSDFAITGSRQAAKRFVKLFGS